MTIKELKKHLNTFKDDSLEVTILDGFNAQGNKRTINFAPSKTKKIEADDEGGEFKKNIGKDVVVLGFGYY